MVFFKILFKTLVELKNNIVKTFLIGEEVNVN